MEIDPRLLHFLIVAAIAICADLVLTSSDHIVEAWYEEPIEPQWSGHHPVVAASLGGRHE